MFRKETESVLKPINKHGFYGDVGDLFEVNTEYWQHAVKEDPVSELSKGDIICYVGKRYVHDIYYEFIWPNGRTCYVSSSSAFIRSFFLCFVRLEK